MAGQPDIVDMLAKDVGEAAKRRDRNRELAQHHMPELLKLFDDLRALDMQPKMTHFEIYAKDKAA